MRDTRISMSPEMREDICEALNIILGSLIDLQSCNRVAHLNVRGPNFYSLHQMFGDFTSDLDEHIDTLGEVIVGLGGFAQAYCGNAIQNSVCENIPEGDVDYVKLIADCYGALREEIVETVEELLKDNVQGIADTLLGIQKQVEEHLYILEAHTV